MTEKSLIPEKNTVLAVIPARYKSTRFEGKPLADIWGKPMIYYVYQRALEAKLVNDVIVATEDERIQDAVLAFGGKAMMTSDKHQTGTDRVAEVAALTDAEFYVDVQGDEPLINPEAIDAAVKPLLDEPAINVTTLMTRIEEPVDLIDPTVVKVVRDLNDYVLFMTRSPIPYPKVRRDYTLYKQVGTYGFRREFLLHFAKMEQTPLELIEGIEFLRILEHGYRLKGVSTPYDSIGVDTMSDLIEVRKRMAPANNAQTKP